jgi:hypothetical protein
MGGAVAGPVLQQRLLLEVDGRVEPARLQAQPRAGAPLPMLARRCGRVRRG